jgi:ABC-type dipeptide/oligopeptide/nickel transport system permease component
MSTFLLKRFGQSIATLFAVSVFAFAMIHLVPGDPVTIALGSHATPEAVAQLRHQLGLDQSLPQQYWSFIGNALHGNLGTSIRSEQSVYDEIISRAGSTVTLALSATVLAVIFGVGVGVVAAISRRSVDLGVMTTALAGLSMPTFWSGILLILLFGLTWHVLPVVGGGGLAALVLPSVTLALPAAAVLARITRGSMLEVLGQDFVRTARAKGIGRARVVLRHVLPNAIVPVVTIVGLQVGGLLSGTVVVESLFARPGVGRLAVQAIQERDFPVVQGVVLVAGLVFVVVNLITDMLYPLLDPRIRR